MSETIANQQPRTTARRNNNRRRGGSKTKTSGDHAGATAIDMDEKSTSPTTMTANTTSVADGNLQVSNAEEVPVCFICAEPVKYYSVSQCNHRTCHVCALRLRALYKKLECTFCKEPQHSVILTTNPEAPFSSYTPEAIPHKDPRLSIFFETQEMMEETLVLLRFNCPDSSCDYMASGWGDLKLHVRGMHGKLMCDLCIRTKKVFAHEHALYAPNQLPFHLPSIPHSRPKRDAPVPKIEGGIHPLCEFCRECFFSDDELYPHMRERHEECFVCKRQEIRDQYFKDYNALEQHFTHAHYPCKQPECLAQKFVVFGSTIDLQAHMVDVHGGDMSTRDKKAAMNVHTDFQFEGSGGRGRGQRDRRGEREPPPAPQPSRPGGGGPGGGGPGPGGGRGRRREGFGAHLTSNAGTDTVATPRRSPSPAIERRSPSPGGEVDPVQAQRHAAFMSRLHSLAPNPTNAEVAVKAAIRSYRASESASRDLISTVWNILDRNLDDTATIVTLLVDLLDNEEKKQDLLGSWNGFKIEQRRQFPDLVPTSVGAGFAGITSGRVLNAKHSTATRTAPSASRVWDRVAQAAASSSRPSNNSSSTSNPTPARLPERFPPLQPSAPSAVTAPRSGQHKTPWTTGGPSPARTPAAEPRIVSVPGPGATVSSKAKGGPTPKLSSTAFPGLPTATNTRAKPVIGGNSSLKKIVGETGPAVKAWGSGGGGGSSAATTQDDSARTASNGSGGTREIAPDVADDGSAAKGKKGKGKQKQTLFTLGAFPA